MPCTVKQILNSADGDSYIINGQEVLVVKVIGTIFDIESNVNFVFKLNDGTGLIECKQWKDPQVPNTELEKLKNGDLVKIHANIKGENNQIYIAPAVTTLVTDWNELSHHNAEVIHTHLLLTKGQPSVSFIH